MRAEIFVNLNMNQDESLIIDEIYLRASKLVSNTEGDLKNKCILYTANTMQRICKTQKMKNNALKYFLLSFILASTRAWNQFYNQKKGLLDFINTSSLADLDFLQEEMIDSPPEILFEPIDLSPMKVILIQNIEILSLICNKNIVPTDIEKFMKFNKVLIFEFKDEGNQNQAALLMGLSTFDGKITHINHNRQGQDQIDTYLHEFCHNFYRFMLENNQPDCLSPVNNKSIMISKSRIELRQKLQEKRILLHELQRKNIDLKDFNKKYVLINQRILTNDKTEVHVESGDYFDFHVLNKAIIADPYSLLIKIQKNNFIQIVIIQLIFFNFYNYVSSRFQKIPSIKIINILMNGQDHFKILMYVYKRRHHLLQQEAPYEFKSSFDQETETFKKLKLLLNQVMHMEDEKIEFTLQLFILISRSLEAFCVDNEGKKRFNYNKQFYKQEIFQLLKGFNQIFKKQFTLDNFENYRVLKKVMENIKQNINTIKQLFKIQITLDDVELYFKQLKFKEYSIDYIPFYTFSGYKGQSVFISRSIRNYDDYWMHIEWCLLEGLYYWLIKNENPFLISSECLKTGDYPYYELGDMYISEIYKIYINYASPFRIYHFVVLEDKVDDIITNLIFQMKRMYGQIQKQKKII